MTARRAPIFGLFLLVSVFAANAPAAERRLLSLDDLARVVEVSDPQMAPRGDWVAYVATTTDVEQDALIDDLWLANWRTGASVRLTATPDSESLPRWSADGSRLGFLSSRGDDQEITQLWTIKVDGGEAQRVTTLKGDVEDFAFAPDGRHVALIVADVDPQIDAEEDATPPPIVIDRYYFKEDETGYLGAQRSHLYLLDLQDGQVQLLTPGPYDEGMPSWSPDASQIAFVSKRSGADPDRHDRFGVYVIPAKPGAEPRLVTEFQGAGADTEWASAPQWSPDGKQLALVVGGDPKLLYYAGYGVAVVPVSGGAARRVTPATLDRNTWQPSWSADGQKLRFLIEDDRTQQLAQVVLKSGVVSRLTAGHHTISAYSSGSDGRIAALRATGEQPDEVYALTDAKLRQLSHQNDALLAELKLSTLEALDASSRDGTTIGGFVLKPPGDRQGDPLPTVLRIHGGPVSQFDYSFHFDWQLLAANGYAVVAGNPRGSSGRGEAFSAAIYADWGNKDVQDVLALVDRAVALGIADPARLGVGGWSYGGMLTNYVIASDARFKAATSGASIANIVAGYGTDMYIREYETELGTPWERPEVWARVSYPFLHADRISTPTLFLCGEVDFNVPLLNSEQMYQALRSRNVPTQLVIYPGEAHGLSTPSYLRDRLARYLAWYGRHLH